MPAARFFIFVLLFALIAAYVGKWLVLFIKKYKDKEKRAFENEWDSLEEIDKRLREAKKKK